MNVQQQLLITVDEAARRLEISKSMVYKLIRQGRLKTVKVGANRRIKPEALAEYVESLTD